MKSIISIFGLLTILSLRVYPNYKIQSDKIQNIIKAKVCTLPEVKEWFITAKKSKPAIIINAPDAKSKYYSAQIGLSNYDQFRTSYWLYIDPKPMKYFIGTNWIPQTAK